MKTMKTLMLAACAALSIGAGTAVAQDGGGGGPDYWSRPTLEAAKKAATNYGHSAAPVDSGSSDAPTRERGAPLTAEFIYSHGLYGAGGMGG